MRTKPYNLLAQCKPAMTLVVITMIYSSNANAYQTVTSEALFQSLFQDPTHIIDFTHLKDGSFFGGSNTYSSPLVVATINGGARYEVRDDAWSNDVYIGSTYHQYCGCAWGGTAWYGSYVTPTLYDMTYNPYDRLYILNPSNTTPAFPVAINTSGGFIGFIPDNAVDGRYLLNPGVTISSVQYGFSAVAVPEPESYAMMMAGLGLMGIAVSRRKSKLTLL
mgnify:CR=1 FL=1